jgi:hypothetical protein
MLKIRYAMFATLLSLTACNSKRTPNDNNLRRAINQYLQTHGQACTSIGQTFPVDISDSQHPMYGIASRMAALEHVGLVQSTTTETTAPQIFGGTIRRTVKRYLPTVTGRQYLKQTPSFPRATELCYGTKIVGTIVTWTEPAAIGPYMQTQVAYTYKIPDLASWAEDPDVQEQFNDVRTTVSGISKTSELAGLELTNRGWEVAAK